MNLFRLWLAKSAVSLDHSVVLMSVETVVRNLLTLISLRGSFVVSRSALVTKRGAGSAGDASRDTFVVVG